MSHHKTPSASQPSLIREPELSPLQLEAICEYAEVIKKTPLSAAEQAELKNFLDTNLALKELARLQNQFVSVKHTMSLLAGLTPKQASELHLLIGKVRAFKEIRKQGEVKNSDYKEFLLNEKKIAPLSNTIDWWNANMTALKKLEVWENIGAMIVAECNKNKESEASIKEKLHKLTDIKNEWIKHQTFACYTSSQLNTFYVDYACKMESWLLEALTNKEKERVKKPVIINDYLNYLLYQIRELKKHVLYSMLQRLNCAEANGDIKNDDILTYTCEQIYQKCNVRILQSNKNPKPRRSLTPSLVGQYIKILQEYCHANPAETALLENLRRLKLFREIPQWKTWTDEATTIKQLTSDPVILFTENLFPELLEKAYSQNALITQILANNVSEDKSFLLNKLRLLVKTTNQIETAKSNDKKFPHLNNLLHKIALQQTQKYQNLLNDLSIKINIKIKELIDSVLDVAFSTESIAPEKTTKIITQIQHAVEFNKHFLNLEYNPDCDIIFAIAMRIQHFIEQSQDITPYHIKNILNILKLVSPEHRLNDLEPLKKVLAKLPDTAKSLNEENKGELLHLLVNFIESAILTKEYLPIAINRHRYIALLYHEKWDESFAHTATMPDSQKSGNDVFSYIKNILLKIIQISPYIDFSNFVNNEMLTALNDMESSANPGEKVSAEDKQRITTIRIELQKQILFKLNDLFAIKTYLHSHTDSVIDLEKLRALLDRLNIFFTDRETHHIIFESVTKAIKLLLTSYCLNIIKADLTLDAEYIRQLNDLLNTNLLEQASKETELLKTLKTYIATCSGSKNNMAALILQLCDAQNLALYDSHIIPYAKKRLEYIKASRDVSTQDYEFFFRYEKHPQIAKLLADMRAHFKPLIQTLLARAETPWDKNFAFIVELFGDDKEMQAYRLKGMLELLALPDQQTNNAKAQEIVFTEFKATIHPFRLINQRWLNPAMLIKEKLTLQQYLEQVIAKRPWSLLLENIIETCGTHDQLNMLHSKWCLDALTNYTDTRNTWLFQKTQNGVSDAQKIDALSDEKNNALEKNFYIYFFGAENCKRLCQSIEKILLELSKANSTYDTRALEKDEYKQLTSMIIAVRPFLGLYSAHGTNKSAQAEIVHIDNLENKLRLHYQLYTVLKRQTSLLNISSENTELHNLILTIIDTIRKIETKQLLSEQNINAYLAFFEKEILSRLETILAETKSTLSFKILYNLANLMLYLASDALKEILFEANKKYMVENPYWLTLINRMDERSQVNYLLENQRDIKTPSLANSEFQHILLFAKRLTSIKHQIHQQIKVSILNEAGITVAPNDPANINAIFNSMKLKDSQYIKLWTACAEKLQKNNIDAQFKINYLNFVIKFMNKIANEILLRARDNTSLLDEFIQGLSHVYSIKASLDNLAKNSDKINSLRKSQQQFFNRSPEPEKSLQPLFVMVDKALALQLLQRLEKYAGKIIASKHWAAFKALFNAAQYHSPAADLTLDPADIKARLSISDEKDFAKIQSLLRVYVLLNKIYLTGNGTAKLTALLDTLTTEAAQHAKLKHSKTYLNFLAATKEFSDKYFKFNGDRSALFIPNTKARSSLFHY